VDGDLLRKRIEWFYNQRAYPLGYIPAGARSRALEKLRQKPAKKAATAMPGRYAPGQSVATVSSQWTSIGPQPTNTPFTAVVSGRVSALAIDPRDANVVYLGAAQGGVWKTTDGGLTWTPLTDTQASLAIGSIALDPSNPDTVYAGTGEENFSADSYYGAGILKSVDGGASWQQLPGPFVGRFDSSSFFGGGARIGSLAVHPTNSQILLAAVQLLFRDGIYRSTDGGTTWTRVLFGAPGTGVLFDPTNGNIAYAALGAVGGNSLNGVYKSTDAGETWSPDNGSGTNVLPSINVGRIAMAMAPSSPVTLYVGIQNSSPGAFGNLLGFFKTVDGGQNWTPLPATPDYCRPQCWYDHVIGAHPTNPDVIYAGGAFFTTLVRSLDGGATWTVLSSAASGSPLHADMHALAFSTDGTKLYLGNDGGVWSTTDVTATTVNFTPLNTSLAITQFYPGISIRLADLNAGFGGTQDNGVQRYSGVLPWFQVECGDGGWTAIDFNTPSIVYATCEQIRILKSTSNGDFGSWGPAQTGINTSDRVQFIPPFVMDPANPQILYFGTFRVYQTSSGASSWTAISPDLTGGGTLTTIAVAPTDSNTVYVGTSDSRVQVTTNAGASWTDRSAGLPRRFITQVASDPASSTTAYVTLSGFSGFLGDTQGHVFKTTDGAASWSDISGDLPNIPVNDIVIDPDQTNTVYVATDIGVFQTTDGGTSWTPLGSGLPTVAVLGLKLHRASRTLRAATHGRSAWDLALGVPGPGVGLSPTSLEFGNQTVGTTSAAQVVTLTNTGGAPLNITSITLGGTNSGDFAFDPSTTCPLTGAQVVPGNNCVIAVTFTPTELGARSALVSIADDAPGSPQTVPLTGTAISGGPTVNLTPTSLDFGTQAVGTTSGTQIVTLTDTGTATLNISGIR